MELSDHEERLQNDMFGIERERLSKEKSKRVDQEIVKGDGLARALEEISSMKEYT